MLPDLPESYYLDNVRTLFAHVTRVYADILDPPRRDFLEDFAALGEDAQRLCIRLLNRSADCYRLGKLNYPEIGALDAAAEELARAGLVELDGELDAAVLLSLFTKAELLSALDQPGELARLRRDELDAALLEAGDADFFARLRRGERLLELSCREHYQRCQMLFFGNLNQSMTDFVLRDLGLYQFEGYQIDHRHRPYRSALEIEQHWLLHQLETLFVLGDVEDLELLDQIVALLPQEIDAASPAFRNSERLRHQVARQLERLGELDAALALYRQCPLPPSRERIARILEQQGQARAAFETCREIAANPLDDEELQFACMFAARLAARHGLAAPAEVEQQRISHRPEIVELELERADSVEAAVAACFNRRDGCEDCYYLENSLFNGVLGLLIWDIVFAPLPGAFYNPFQHRPSDFYTPDFYPARRALFDALWRSLGDNDGIHARVSACWRRKHGLMNPLVNWQALDLELIELALARIDFAHWRAIFGRILRDLRNNRAGFPDLVHFPPQGGYRLIEVKGPGDTLQKNQQRWMQFFHEHGIPHRLVRVTWR